MCSNHVSRTSVALQPGFKMPINKGGGVWERLGLDRSRIPNPLAPLVSFVHTEGPQALLRNTEPTVKLQAIVQRATDVCAVWPADYARLAMVAAPIVTWQLNST